MRGVRFYKDLNGCPCPQEGKNYATKFNGMAIYHECAIFFARNYWDNWHCLSVTGFDGSGDGPYKPHVVSGEYKRANLVRISEARARELFPNLIKMLDELRKEKR